MRQLQCMEIWGGNQSAQECIQLAGLDVWLYSRPHAGDADGGDVHYLSSCATGRITRLLLADVSGHGQRVAEIATHLRSLMHRYVNYINQNRFLAELNQQFLQHATHGRFATAIAMTYFSPTNELALCNAGHPRPLVYRVTEARWEWLDDAGVTQGEVVNIPLGVTSEACYRPSYVPLRAGDQLFCYTDSLIEVRNESDQQLGEDGLRGILNSIDISNDVDLIEQVLSKVQTMTGRRPTQDDLTMMLVKPTVTAYQVPWFHRLRAPWLVIKALLKGLLGAGPGIPATEFSVRNLGGALFHSLNRLRF